MNARSRHPQTFVGTCFSLSLFFIALGLFATVCFVCRALQL